MKTAIMELWVKALRSGKFKQGTGALLDTKTGEKRYCCLGVLCELHRRQVKKDDWTQHGLFVNDRTYLGESGALPQKVRNWAGLVNGGSHAANHAEGGRRHVGGGDER